MHNQIDIVCWKDRRQRTVKRQAPLSGQCAALQLDHLGSQLPVGLVFFGFIDVSSEAVVKLRCSREIIKLPVEISRRTTDNNV